MIVQFDEKGRIFHLVSDPVHSAIALNMQRMGANYLDLEPVDGVSFECDIMRDWVDKGEIKPRPVFDLPDLVEIAADGSDSHQIAGLPDPCLVRIDGEEISVEGGELTIAADMPAEYEIRFVQWPYIEHVLKVIAR